MKNSEFASIITTIAARKTQFYLGVGEQLLKSLPKEIGKQTALKSIQRAIAGLDDTLFIGREEKETGVINPETPLTKLGLDSDKILNEIILKLSNSL